MARSVSGVSPVQVATPAAAATRNHLPHTPIINLLVIPATFPTTSPRSHHILHPVAIGRPRLATPSQARRRPRCTSRCSCASATRAAAAAPSPAGRTTADDAPAVAAAFRFRPLALYALAAEQRFLPVGRRTYLLISRVGVTASEPSSCGRLCVSLLQTRRVVCLRVSCAVTTVYPKAKGGCWCCGGTHARGSREGSAVR